MLYAIKHSNAFLCPEPCRVGHTISDAGSETSVAISLLLSTTGPVLPFQPNYRSGHPENYLFSLSKKIFSGSKYPKIKLFNFEKGSTERKVLRTAPTKRNGPSHKPQCVRTTMKITPHLFEIKWCQTYAADVYTYIQTVVSGSAHHRCMSKYLSTNNSTFDIGIIQHQRPYLVQYHPWLTTESSQLHRVIDMLVE